LAERQQLLGEQAARRRGEQRLQCGLALRAMRDRGESVGEIARIVGIAERTVRELIRDADEMPASGVAAGSGVDAPTELLAAMPESVPGGSGSESV
jgi:hypothetical protein